MEMDFSVVLYITISSWNSVQSKRSFNIFSAKHYFSYWSYFSTPCEKLQITGEGTILDLVSSKHRQRWKTDFKISPIVSKLDIID